MQDLQALRKDKFWKELLDNAKDIRPAERSEEWKGLVIEATKEYLPTLNNEYNTFTILSLIQQYPFLKENTDFVAASGNLIFSNVKKCLDDGEGEICEQNYTEFMKSTPFLHEAAKKIADYFRQYRGDIWKSAITPLYELALVPQVNNKVYCADPKLEESVFSSMKTPSYSQPAISARNIIFKLCKDEFKAKADSLYKPIVDESTQPDVFYARNYCVENKRADCEKD